MITYTFLTAFSCNPPPRQQVSMKTRHKNEQFHKQKEWTSRRGRTMLCVQYPLVMIMNKKGSEGKILKYAQEKRQATQSSFIIWTGNVSAPYDAPCT
jgi:hypothetical protein